MTIIFEGHKKSVKLTDIVVGQSDTMPFEATDIVVGRYSIFSTGFICTMLLITKVVPSLSQADSLKQSDV